MNAEDAIETENVPFTPEYWETWSFKIPSSAYTDYIGNNSAFSVATQYFSTYRDAALPAWDDSRPWYFVSLQSSTDQAFYPCEDATGSKMIAGALFRSSSVFVLLSREQFGAKKEGVFVIGAAAGADTWITFARRRKKKARC